MKKAFINWSSGKDAAFALYRLQEEGEYSVGKLVTTVNKDLNRISMHGIREELLIQQAKNLRIPLHIIPLAGKVSMADYNATMQREVSSLVSQGFQYSIYGDIFLKDLRQYREKQLEGSGLKAVFPLWKKNTATLAREIIAYGFKAITVCVNTKVLDESFCGRIIDEDFLSDLPTGVDPCGENGEFHTFVYDGPNFSAPVNFKIGEKVQRSYEPKEKEEDNCFSNQQQDWDTNFWYCDLKVLGSKI